MRIAIIAAAFVFIAGIAGRFLNPTPEQLRPLTPEPSGDAGGGHHDDHASHH